MQTIQLAIRGMHCDGCAVRIRPPARTRTRGAVLWEPGRRLLDRPAGFSVRVPVVVGMVLIGLGLWSVYFGLFVNLEDWA